MAASTLSEAKKARTQRINRMQRHHPGTRRQRSYHGLGRYSVQFFCRTTGKLVADSTSKTPTRGNTTTSERLKP